MLSLSIIVAPRSVIFLDRERRAGTWNMFNVSDGIELQITLNENLVKYWDECNTGDLSANALLKKCSRIYSPATISK